MILSYFDNLMTFWRGIKKPNIFLLITKQNFPSLLSSKATAPSTGLLKQWHLLFCPQGCEEFGAWRRGAWFKIALFVLHHHLCRAQLSGLQTSVTDAVVHREGLRVKFPEEILIRNKTSYSSLEWVQGGGGKKSEQEMKKKTPKRKIEGRFSGVLYWKALDRKYCAYLWKTEAQSKQ